MASCSTKNNGSMLFKAKRPSFFKIILDHSIREKKLSIPRKFVKRYGHYLSNPVTLKVPTGIKWEVQIVKTDGEIWLQNGWPEFAEFYSVTLGSFLVFEFEQRDCDFSVIIFDKTATEIQYPFTFRNVHQKFHEESKVIPSRKTKVKSPITLPPSPHKKKKLEISAQLEGKKENGSSHDQKQMVIHRASSSSQSENPTFHIKMQPSDVQCRTDLYIPDSFAGEYMNRKDGDAVLNVSDGRKWSVKYCTNLICGVKRTKILRSDWKIFVLDNHLQVGDVCIFELIDAAKVVLRVAISRSTNIGKMQTQKMDSGTGERVQKRSCSNCAKAIESAKKFASGNPFFQVVMTASYLEGDRVHVPSKFMKKLEQRTHHEAKLLVDNRLWFVKLLDYPQHRKGELSQGWFGFARQNSLQVGDVCSFELIDSQELLMKVSIARDVSRN